VIYLSGQLCETRDAVSGDTRRYFQQGTTSTTAGAMLIVADHLGSPTDVTDSTGARLAAYAYAPFGARERLLGSVDIERNFTGHRNIGTLTEVLHTPSRIYNVELGRFLGEDPARSGLNFFTYANNNPLRYIDRDGRNPVAAGAAIGGAIGTVIEPGGGTAAGAAAGAVVGGIILGLIIGEKIVELINEKFSKGGKQNIRDEGLANKTDAEIAAGARDRSISKEERERYKKEEKARRMRNRRRRCGM
jgi:RHS repeat-associated protein